MKRIVFGLGILMIGYLTSCNHTPKKPSDMTNRELLDAYEQVEMDIRHPHETTAPGHGLFNETEILATADENLEKSQKLRLELLEEMRIREFTPEEQKRYHELTDPSYQVLQEMILEVTDRILADSVGSEE